MQCPGEIKMRQHSLLQSAQTGRHKHTRTGDGNDGGVYHVHIRCRTSLHLPGGIRENLVEKA